VASNEMFCSVVIPTYNREDLLRRTLESMTVQSLPRHKFEVLVVDDGSTDRSREVAASFSVRLNLKYFYQEHQGYRVARARNIGIRNASSGICVFIDSGVSAHSECLQAHVESHVLAKTPVAVCGYVYGFNEDNEDAEEIRRLIGDDSADAAIGTFERSKIFLDLREEFYTKYKDEFSELPAPWLVFWTCNASAPTSLLRAVSMFDENFQSWGAEDIDVGYRLYRAGAKVILNRKARSLHYPHLKSYTDNMRDASGNYQYFSKKYGTPICALVPHHQFFLINEIVLRNKIPFCQEYDRQLQEKASRLQEKTDCRIAVATPSFQRSSSEDAGDDL
jgi:glycosyltransferase involved in cell wall biosynthesis